MGYGFELRIGMTTQQVMSNISRMNATDKTKQMIINFCNNDQDKKISNEMELAMLNSWASGSDRVIMPNADGLKQLKSKPIGYMTVSNSEQGEKLYRTSNSRLFGTVTNNKGENVAFSSHYYDYSKGFFKTDYLVDKDNDGYADYRQACTLQDKDDADYHNIHTGYTDVDLDGTFDEKSVSEIKLNEFIQTERTATTDLHTGETKKTYDKYDIRKGK